MSALNKRNLSIFLLLILAYVGYVNAYDLLYVPDEGRQIELSGGELYKPSRYFEKVEIYSNPKTDVEKSSIDFNSKHVYNPSLSGLTERIQPPQQTMQSQVEQRASATPTPQQTYLPKVASPSDQNKEQMVSPISIAEVQQLSSKLQLSELSEGSILELHISQSYSEVFTIRVQGGVNVASGETSNEDIEVWIDRSAFKEILAASDISSTAKRSASEGKISVTQKVSTWTLYRKGCKSLAGKLGLI